MLLPRLASRSSCVFTQSADVHALLAAASIKKTSCIFVYATHLNELLWRLASRSMYATDVGALLLAASFKKTRCVFIYANRYGCVTPAACIKIKLRLYIRNMCIE